MGHHSWIRRLEPRSRPEKDSSYSSYGSSSSSYGSSSSYNRDKYVTPPSSPSYSNYNSNSYSSYGKSSHYGSNDYSNHHSDALHVPLAWVILIALGTYCVSTLGTAYQFEHKPEGNFANFCRLCLNTLDCIWKLIYNLYHCRLNEIPTVVCATDDEDDYTEQELLTMKLRPGIGRALEVEHQKSMKKTAQQIKSMKSKRAKTKGLPNKNGLGVSNAK